MPEEGADSFASVLREAIQARGLTLGRIVHRLEERGFALSAATLSYWSKGRYRPARPESLAALVALEEILDLPAGSLRARLSPRVRRGRSRAGRIVPLRELWGDVGAEVDQVIAEIGMPTGQERVLSLHERHQLDDRGLRRRCRVIMMIEATAEHVDRTVVIHRDNAAGAVLPTARPVSGVRLGRVAMDEATQVHVAELLLDTALRRGQRTVIEYELRFGPGGNRSTSCERSFRSPVKQYVVEVLFTPWAVPARFRLEVDAIGGAPAVRAPELVRGRDAVRAVLLDQPAGTYRVEWDWDQR